MQIQSSEGGCIWRGAGWLQELEGSCLGRLDVGLASGAGTSVGRAVVLSLHISVTL